MVRIHRDLVILFIIPGGVANPFELIIIKRIKVLKNDILIIVTTTTDKSVRIQIADLFS